MSVPPRVLLAAFTDDPALTVLARTLRDEGVEVIYAGVVGGAAEVISAAEQEDPAVVAVSPADPDDALAAAGLRVVAFRTVQEGAERVKMATAPRSPGRR